MQVINVNGYANAKFDNNSNNTDREDVGVLVSELLACLGGSAAEAVFGAVHSVAMQRHTCAKQCAVTHVTQQHRHR